MSTVYLKIENMEEFKKDLNIATIDSPCPVVDTIAELLKHELQGVTEFKAEVCRHRPDYNIAPRGSSAEYDYLAQKFIYIPEDVRKQFKYRETIRVLVEDPKRSRRAKEER